MLGTYEEFILGYKETIQNGTKIYFTIGIKKNFFYNTKGVFIGQNTMVIGWGVGGDSISSYGKK